jgi:hypothetical protein
MNQHIARKAASSRPDGLARLATLALAIVAACGGTVGFENSPPGTTSDASVAPSVDAPPVEHPVDASVADTGTDDDSVIERPPARDTGAPSGPAMDDGSVDAGPNGGNGRPVTTSSLFAAFGPDCLWCTVMNGCLDPAQFGGTCEVARSFGSGCDCGMGSQGADGGSGGGDASSVGGGACTFHVPTNPTDAIKCYSDICTRTLEDIFSTQCAASLQETPCLCGATDPAACLGGSAVPTGPLVPDYEIDFPVTPGLKTEGPSIQMYFTDQSYGAGQANELVQCSAAYGCTTCFGGVDGGIDAGAPYTGAGGAATQAILSAQSSDCLSCAQSTGCLDPQMGGSCEDTPGTATLPGQTLSDGGTCAGAFGSSSPTETQLCLGTLQAIFASGCQPTAQDPVTLCLSGATISRGLADQYLCGGFPDPSDPQEQKRFVDRTLGAGRANALAQCLGANRCDSCFHGAPEAGAPEAGAGADH